MPYLDLAAARPESLLPCPLCGAEVKGRNLHEHVERKHAGQTPPVPPLRGRGPLGLPRTLTVNGDRVRCGRREVTLPAPLLAGRWERKRSYGNPESSNVVSSEIVREGAFLQIGDLVVLCRRAPGVAKLWTGAAQGKTRRRGHLRLPLPEFTALVYLLADRGDLTPR